MNTERLLSKCCCAERITTTAYVTAGGRSENAVAGKTAGVTSQRFRASGVRGGSGSNAATGGVEAWGGALKVFTNLLNYRIQCLAECIFPASSTFTELNF